jgi:hypothetical protein
MDLVAADAMNVPAPARGPSHRFGIDARLVLLLLVITAATRLIYVVRMQGESLLDIDGELLNVATSLVNTGRYADPFGAGPTGVTAHVAPVTTFLLAAILKLTPDIEVATLVSRLLAVASACLQLLAMLAIARNSGLPARESLAGGLVLAVYPANPFCELNGAWEHAYAALALACLALLLLPPITTARAALARGCATGFALLVTPVAILFVAGLFARRVLVQPRALLSRRSAGLIAVGLCGLVVTVAPWLVRNRIALGYWINVRSNFGIELRVSNSELATPSFPTNGKSFSTYHPHLSKQAVARIREIGEVGYNIEMRANALRWIREHPADFVRLTIARASLFWLPRSGGLRTIAEACELVLAIIGVAVVVSERRSMLVDLALGCVAFSGIYYLVQFDFRYSYPIQWAMALFVGIALVALARRVNRFAVRGA